MRAIGSYMTKNILILFALVLLASTSNWVPLYTDGTLTGGGYEDSPLGVDTSKVATTYDLMSAAGGASYDVYTAILTQTGTDAPVATVLDNTLGGTVVWTYEEFAIYYGTLSGVFTSGKTFIILSHPRPGQGTVAYWGDVNTIVISGDDDYGSTTYPMRLEIRVYP